ncbi:ABC transporter substrate-binding protein [Bosea sp. (in: a-proteobacteria)]|uniref:ABC transporter substrate-binding protein n=1 Tax=Bosea sp. (in: a-proteobacteria) TaxID=1871050 RepID=UPI003B3BCADD
MTRLTRRTAIGCLFTASALLKSGAVALAQDGSTIRLGLTTALTGPYNEFGEGTRRGFDLAIDLCNAKGGVNGRKVEIATALDDQMVPDRAAQNMRRLLDDASLVGILGPAGSGATMAVVDMATADGRVFINPLAQAPAATYPAGLEKPPRPNVFQFGILSPVEAEVLGSYIAKTYKSIGLLHESTSYGVSGRDTLLAVIKQINPDMKILAESYNQRATDVTAQLVRIQRADVEALLVVGLGTDLVNIRRSMGRLGLQQPLVTSAGGLSLPYFEGAGEAAVGTIAPMVSALVDVKRRPEVTAFIDAYKAKFGADRYWGPDADRPQIQMSLIVIPAFDGLNVLLEGIRRAGSTESTKVIAAIEGLDGFPGVNTTYSFSKQRHHGIGPQSLAMLKVVKQGNRLGLEVLPRT